MAGTKTNQSTLTPDYVQGDPSSPNVNMPDVDATARSSSDIAIGEFLKKMSQMLEEERARQEQRYEMNMDKMFGLFAESPQYEMPREIRDIYDVYSGASQEMQSQARSNQAYLRSMWAGGGNKIIQDIQQAQGDALGLAREDSQYIRNLQEQSTREQVAGVKGMRGDVLNTLTQSGDIARDLAQQRAFGEYTPRRLLTEQQQASQAQLQRGLQEAGTGSGATLAAMAQSYGQGQQAQRDIALQEYYDRQQGLGAYQQTEMTLGQQMADAQRLTALDVAGVQRQATSDLQNAYMGTSQYQAGLMGNYADRLANARLNITQGQSQAEIASQQTLQQAISGGAALEGAGLGTIAAEAEKQYQYNQLEPYQRQREFMINEMRRLDPYSSELSLYGDMTGMNYMNMMMGQQGLNLANINSSNTWSQGISGLTNLLSLIGMMGGFSSGNGDSTVTGNGDSTVTGSDQARS